MKTENQIFQQILDKVLDVINEKWGEISVRVRVDDESDELIVNYFINENGVSKKKPLGYISNLFDLLEELREYFAQGGKLKFTHCVIKYSSTGEFKADYSYDPVDWEIIDGTWSIEASQKS